MPNIQSAESFFMGRRSTHTPEQLRTLILDASQEIVEEDGLSGVSAREIARRIDYSPGTIYNMFSNLDDVILNVEARVLTELGDRLRKSMETSPSEDRIRPLAQAYLAFTHEKPRLWNLLFEHYMPEGSNVPDWYQEKLDGLMSEVERALAPYFDETKKEEQRRAARVLWAGVHGITSLSTANKLATVTTQAASELVDDLVSTYLLGLKARNS